MWKSTVDALEQKVKESEESVRRLQAELREGTRVKGKLIHKQKYVDLENEKKKQDAFVKDLEGELKQVTRKKSNLAKRLKEIEDELNGREEEVIHLLKIQGKLNKALLMKREEALSSMESKLKVLTPNQYNRLEIREQIRKLQVQDSDPKRIEGSPRRPAFTDRDDHKETRRRLAQGATGEIESTGAQVDAGEHETEGNFENDSEGKRASGFGHFEVES